MDPIGSTGWILKRWNCIKTDKKLAMKCLPEQGTSCTVPLALRHPSTPPKSTTSSLYITPSIMTDSILLQLPAEIREYIFMSALKLPFPIVIDTDEPVWHRLDHLLCFSLALVNHQIRHETFNLFYNLNTFVFETDYFTDVLQDPDDGRAAVRKLENLFAALKATDQDDSRRAKHIIIGLGSIEQRLYQGFPACWSALTSSYNGLLHPGRRLFMGCVLQLRFKCIIKCNPTKKRLFGLMEEDLEIHYCFSFEEDSQHLQSSLDDSLTKTLDRIRGISLERERARTRAMHNYVCRYIMQAQRRRFESSDMLAWV
jgi:hypothetical protein